MSYQWINQKRRKEINGPSAAVIRYDEGEDSAPRVVAHGKGMIAKQIISLAQKHDIPMQEDPTLLDNLIDMDLGENIPPQLYSVIAEILLMIQDIEKKI